MRLNSLLTELIILQVISLVRLTLNDLKLAIDGTIIMSENLRDALDCMYDARIPTQWLKVITTDH